MDKWEYTEKWYDVDADTMQRIRWLNEMGQEGWELVSIRYETDDWIFKRVKR